MLLAFKYPRQPQLAEKDAKWEKRKEELHAHLPQHHKHHKHPLPTNSPASFLHVFARRPQWSNCSIVAPGSKYGLLLPPRPSSTVAHLPSLLERGTTAFKAHSRVASTLGRLLDRSLRTLLMSTDGRPFFFTTHHHHHRCCCYYYYYYHHGRKYSSRKNDNDRDPSRPCMGPVVSPSGTVR